MFLVVFRNHKRADIDADAYISDAVSMEALAEEQPGFLLFRSYTADDGEVLSMSEWEDEACAMAWSRNAEHMIVQLRGRDEYYERYTLYACPSPRVHRFDMNMVLPAKV
ncbi:antibiotic biosynthesis monooxygenase [Novosphingobium sp. P6W]|uniref:antibiotic biosynthesis monooxygenase family protein n=1 Tax=Novosphingobium sp. P6W TaxID=1609758 RepID=UPI0005C31899|nr:antibiotic biosynthesis monooxygenase [Novosphingobium sp. P6W]AXB75573.1 antibiotic biosynthesis monooxygenase [Novosphingobium sp. P6W]KIS29652.1 polysaccharide biosynthesis protein [Novosphingobium sp. P6W]